MLKIINISNNTKKYRLPSASPYITCHTDTSTPIPSISISTQLPFIPIILLVAPSTHNGSVGKTIMNSGCSNSSGHLTTENVYGSNEVRLTSTSLLYSYLLNGRNK